MDSLSRTIRSPKGNFALILALMEDILFNFQLREERVASGLRFH